MNTHAVVGASHDHEKYGYKVFTFLAEHDVDVIPINPHEKEIAGKRCYSTLSLVPFPISVVVFVTQPHVTRNVLLEVKKLGIKSVWMQPGAESDEAIAFCEQNGISCVHHACIMQRAQE